LSREREREKKELFFKEENQEYGQILKMLGNGRCETYCFDGVKRLCHIRGKMKKKIWINVGDIVLIGLRDFQIQKGDILLKYNTTEVKNLKACGELPLNVNVNDSADLNEKNEKNETLDQGFDFETEENLDFF
jgi:translation initiation factor 1A